MNFNNKKLKIYLDTSVISHLEQNDAPEKMSETLLLWDRFKNNEFDVYVSQVTIEEVNECNIEKREKLVNYLNQIEYTNLSLTEKAIDIGNQIIALGILKNKSRDDANHIGIAIANGIDFIVSWNFKHMVNIKTVNGIRAITSLNGLNDIGIVAPTFFLGEE